MIVTESDAHSCVCPMLGLDKRGHQYRCTGRSCMAWCWAGKEPDTNVVTRKYFDANVKPTSGQFPPPPGAGWKPIGNPQPPDPSGEEGTGWKQSWTREKAYAAGERLGYCGLAGKPEYH